jgi:hypothetical protein
MLRIIHAGRPATFLRGQFCEECGTVREYKLNLLSLLVTGFDPTLQDSETEAREVDWSSPGALCSLMDDRQVSIAITPHG